MATLYEQWNENAYNAQSDPKALAKLWKDYFEKEKNIYKQLLTNPSEIVEGTVADLAEKYGIDTVTMTGFLDGINESIVKPNDIEKLKEKTKVKLEIIPEKLYKNMIKAKADWLYNLEEWDAIIPSDKRKELAREQRLSGTVVKAQKIGRNDPCPCGSGKKYKNCCGKNA